jgi:hypothetical protein
MPNNHTIDLCIGWGPWPDEPFLNHITERCTERRLNLVVCKDENVFRTTRASETGRKNILMYLDADADYEDPADPYTRLSYAAKDGGAFVVNEPDRAKLGLNKAIIHYHFERAHIPIPYTIVVRNWEPSDFKLTPAERKRLGTPFIIKPARGYGKQGVARVNGGSVKEIAKARMFDRGDDFLLQEFIEPKWYGHRRGWFRVFYVLGEIIMCWWDNFTEHYECVTLEQFHEHRFERLATIAHKIAMTTHMNFFSTELAVVGTARRERVLSIDYINDPADMTVKSYSHCGVPDDVVRHIAERLADTAWRLKKGINLNGHCSMWFTH